MNHGIKGGKFSRHSAHRQSMIMNLVRSVIEHEQITTTVAKAKALRPVLERIISCARRGESSLAVRRRLLSFFRGNKTVVSKLLGVLGERYKQRNGGYTRIVKAGFRRGDCAPIAVVELIDRDPSAKKVLRSEAT